MPRFTTDRVPHCCSLETRQSPGTSCSAEITQTEEMRIQKGCLQWQQMVLNNSEYLWVIPHSRDVSRDWHPATLCLEETPHASPCNVQWVLLWQVDTKRAAVFELQAVENPDRCFLAITCYGHLPVAQGQIMKFFLAGAHRLSFQSCSIYFFATCRFLVHGSNLEKLTKRFKEGYRARFNLWETFMFLEEQVLPLGPKTGASSMPPMPLEALHVRLFWQHVWEKWSDLTTAWP